MAKCFQRSSLCIQRPLRFIDYGIKNLQLSFSECSAFGLTKTILVHPHNNNAGSSPAYITQRIDLRTEWFRASLVKGGGPCTYEGRLKSSWTQLITPSRNFVEVRWRSRFRSTSLGKRCTSYNTPLLENVLQTVGRKLQEDSGTGIMLRPTLRGSSFAFNSPSLKCFHHLKQQLVLLHCLHRLCGWVVRFQNSIAQRCCSATLKRVLLKRP
jgi:hypothetical protein